jgi:hypothetical protein
MAGRKNPCTKVLHARRVDDLVVLRLEGSLWRDCLAFVRSRQTEADSNWFVAEGEQPLSDTQLRRYVTAADRAILAQTQTNRRKLFGQHVARREMLYNRCVGTGEFGVALSVLKDTAELCGPYPDPKGKDPPAGCEPVTVPFILVPGTAPQREPVPALLPPESTATVAAEPDSQEPVHLVHPAEAS